MISSIEVDKLFEQYPRLFTKFNGSFDIGPGWFELVKNLCPPLNQYAELLKEFNILNVRKRFGILSIDHSGGDQFTAKMINFAERLSYNTCEECGDKGSLYSSDGTQFGKLATLCEKDSLVRYKKIYDFPTKTYRLFA